MIDEDADNDERGGPLDFAWRRKIRYAMKNCFFLGVDNAMLLGYENNNIYSYVSKYCINI